MRGYIKHYTWFIKESWSFVKPMNKFKFIMEALPKAHVFAKDMIKWDKMTQDQREAWYMSGQGRTIQF